MNRLRVFAALVAAVLIGTVGVAVASIPASDGTINGCYKNTGGDVKIIDSTATCSSGYTAINWNQTGPQGPAGLSSTQYVSQGASGTANPGDHVSVQKACPTGTYVTGGGGNPNSPSDWSLEVSEPLLDNGVPAGWKVIYRYDGTAMSVSYSLVVHTICTN